MARTDVRIAAVVLPLLVVLPLAIREPFYRNILVLTVLFAALAQAWNIVSGFCGQISLGHALYFGIGAYASSILYSRYAVSPLVGMWAGGALSAFVAAVIGIPCFRMKGHYFVIATIVIAEIAYLACLNWNFVGAANGVYLPTGKESFANFQFRSHLAYYYAALVLAAALWLVSLWIRDSKWGYYWRAVKDNDEAAASLGVRIFRSKVAAAALSACATALCGTFYAQYVGYIDPDSTMTFPLSVRISLGSVLGGIGTLWGPALGAALLTPLAELTRTYLGGSGQGIDLVIYGVLIMAVATARPDGVGGLIQVVWRRWLRRASRKIPAADVSCSKS